MQQTKIKTKKNRMAEAYRGEDDMSDEEGEEGGEMTYERDITTHIFLVDCQPTMFEIKTNPQQDPQNQQAKTRIPFSVAISCLRKTLLDIMDRSEGHVAIIFFGTESTNTSYKHLHIYKPLGEIDHKTILDLTALENPEIFSKKLGQPTVIDNFDEALSECESIMNQKFLFFFSIS